MHVPLIESLPSITLQLLFTGISFIGTQVVKSTLFAVLDADAAIEVLADAAVDAEADGSGFRG